MNHAMADPCYGAKVSAARAQAGSMVRVYSWRKAWKSAAN